MTHLLDADYVRKVLELQLQHEVRQIIDEEAANSAEVVRKRVLGLVDKLALSIMAEYDITQRGAVVQVTVRKLFE